MTKAIYRRRHLIRGSLTVCKGYSTITMAGSVGAGGVGAGRHTVLEK